MIGANCSVAAKFVMPSPTLTTGACLRKRFALPAAASSALDAYLTLNSLSNDSSLSLRSVSWQETSPEKVKKKYFLKKVQFVPGGKCYDHDFSDKF
jgi:hypothetical protein